MGTIRWRFVLLGVTAALSALLVTVQIYNRPVDRWADDFAILWYAARLPLQDVYIPGPFLPFAYPPSALPLVKLLGIPPLYLSFFGFVALSAAAFYWAGRRLYSRSAVLMALASPPMVWALAAGQISPLLAAMLFLAFSSPSITKGALVALVLSIKPQLAFMAPLVLWSDKTAFIAMVGTGVALLAFHVAYWGIDIWIEWYKALAWFRVVTRAINVDALVISLPGMARNYGYPLEPFFGLALLISIATAIRKQISDPVVLSVGCSLFASPYALPYDLVVLVPWVAERLLRDKVNGWIWPKVLLYIGFIFPIAWVASICSTRSSSHSPSLA